MRKILFAFLLLSTLFSSSIFAQVSDAFQGILPVTDPQKKQSLNGVWDIKVIEGEKGLFIAMPSKKSADGEYRDIAHPINTETRAMLESIILDEYERSALQEDSASTGTTE